jgi:hypothetical protein
MPAVMPLKEWALATEVNSSQWAQQFKNRSRVIFVLSRFSLPRVPQPALSDPELATGESNGCPLWLTFLNLS